MQHASPTAPRWLLAILIGLLTASLSLAFASHGMSVSAVAGLEFEEEDDDGEDERVETMGIRFELGGGLVVVVTAEAESRIGDVHVPAFAVDALPENALDDVVLHAALRDIGVVRAYPGGITFVLEETRQQRALAAVMAHLRDVGAQIGPFEANGRAFGFAADGVAYRAVFNADPNGTLVYLGH